MAASPLVPLRPAPASYVSLRVEVAFVSLGSSRHHNRAVGTPGRVDRLARNGRFDQNVNRSAARQPDSPRLLVG